MDPIATDTLPTHFQWRLGLYELDAAALGLLAAHWPLVEPVLGTALDRFLALERENPPVRDIFRQHGSEIRRLEQEHLSLILSGRVDDGYVRSSRALSDRLGEFGIYSRTRLLACNLVNRAVLDLAARRWRFHARRAAALARTVGNALDFDVAITMTVQQDSALRLSDWRRASVEAAIGEFEPAIGGVVGAVKTAADTLRVSSAEMRLAATDASHRMASAATVSGEVAVSIEDTAAATEQLAQSIAEIGQQSEDSLRLAHAATEDARMSMARLDELAAAAHQVGSVVDMISTVAAQTNLLALNATIEAARAGEAGRGFAVVAAEVKALAGQTGRATDEISRQIGAIQDATRRSVEQIGSVAGIVSKMAAAATAIAASVEEQGTATRSISEGIRRMAATTTHASGDVRAVEVASGRSLAVAEEIVGWTERLSGEAGQLEQGVAQFFDRVRSTG